MSLPPSNPETGQKLLEILNLLEETFSSKDTKKIKEAKNKLNQIFSSIQYSVDILFEALTYKTILGKEISLDLHKSVSIYLKNIFFAQKNLSGDNAYNYLIKIFDLILNKSQDNPHLIQYSIMTAMQTVILSLLSNQKILEEKKETIEQLFNILLASLKNASNNFLETADVDNNGKIDYAEFLTAMNLGNKEISKTTLKEVFDYYDHDKNGVIEAKDIKEIFEDTGLSDKEIHDLIDEVDLNDDRSLSFDEFYKLITAAI